MYRSRFGEKATVENNGDDQNDNIFDLLAVSFAEFLIPPATGALADDPGDGQTTLGDALRVPVFNFFDIDRYFFVGIIILIMEQISQPILS